jgi:hypothetical protein
MKYLALLILPLLMACEERYRYPCQDPDNWELKQCKKPYCVANGTCPEDLLKYNVDGQNSSATPAPSAPAAPAEVAPKGDCK